LAPVRLVLRSPVTSASPAVGWSARQCADRMPSMCRGALGSNAIVLRTCFPRSCRPHCGLRIMGLALRHPPMECQRAQVVAGFATVPRFTALATFRCRPCTGPCNEHHSNRRQMLLWK
jgi:hypothetical protein